MPKLTNYLVISVDLDEQLDLWDFVSARNARRAEEIVLRARQDYVREVSCVMTATDLRLLADRLDATANAPKSVSELKRSIEL